MFKNCRFTAAENVRDVFLGRPWRPFAQTVIMESYLGGHINEPGWHNWSNVEAESTVFYAVFQNSGEGASAEKRVSWSKQLSEKEALQMNWPNVLRGWNPVSKIRSITNYIEKKTFRIRTNR